MYYLRQAVKHYLFKIKYYCIQTSATRLQLPRTNEHKTVYQEIHVALIHSLSSPFPGPQLILMCDARVSASEENKKWTQACIIGQRWANCRILGQTVSTCLAQGHNTASGEKIKLITLRSKSLTLSQLNYRGTKMY